MTMTVKIMSAEAIINHLRKGIENGGISGHALALYLEDLTQHLASLEIENGRLTAELEQLNSMISDMYLYNYAGAELKAIDQENRINYLDAENGRLRTELDEAQGDYNMTAAILVEFRNGNRVIDSCFSCGEITEWFRQSTDDGGENYCTVCGYCPAEEETEDVPF